MNRFSLALLKRISFLLRVIGIIVVIQTIDQLLSNQTLKFELLLLAFSCLTISMLTQRKLKRRRNTSYVLEK